MSRAGSHMIIRRDSQRIPQAINETVKLGALLMVAIGVCELPMRLAQSDNALGEARHAAICSDGNCKDEVLERGTLAADLLGAARSVVGHVVSFSNNDETNSKEAVSMPHRLCDAAIKTLIVSAGAAQ